jgi:hypothetical protein
MDCCRRCRPSQHARDDFWRAVQELSLADQFHRDDGYGDHDAPYGFAHEVHAIAARNFLCQLNARDSDRNRPTCGGTSGRARRRPRGCSGAGICCMASSGKCISIRKRGRQ